MSIGQLLARAVVLSARATVTRNPERRRDLEAEAGRLTREAQALNQAKDDAEAFARLVQDGGGVWFPGD